MTYVIDAWLERRDPRLRVMETDTGRVVVEWKGDEVGRLVAREGLSPCDFFGAGEAAHQEMAQHLLACGGGRRIVRADASPEIQVLSAA